MFNLAELRATYEPMVAAAVMLTVAWFVMVLGARSACRQLATEIVRSYFERKRKQDECRPVDENQE